MPPVGGDILHFTRPMGPAHGSTPILVNGIFPTDYGCSLVARKRKLDYQTKFLGPDEQPPTHASDERRSSGHSLKLHMNET